MAFLTLACVGVGATEPALQLAYLRAAPQVEKVEKNQEHTPRAPYSPEHAAHRSLGDINFYDPQNPDFNRLQRYEEAVANLPMDANGFPDWMRALRESNIQPRTGLKPNAAMNILNLDIIMKNTREMPFVRFPHYTHTLWLDCSNCHPAPFATKAGSTSIVMADIFRGKYCGMCHDRVAFITFFSCQRCHSVPQPNGVVLPE
ncbi:MAG: c(7)-type cytochrome triheme domain-containing protein [Sterolibacterium sp.]